MTKTFCDLCGVEITVDNETPADGIRGVKESNGKKLMVNITELSTGDHCRYYVLDASTSSDDRPRIL